MALSIKHPDADRLARSLAELTGESITEATIRALEERLRRMQGRARGPQLAEDLRAIRERCAALPMVDVRSPDEILGYDSSGAPT